jgi:predicted GIY-YIG superfamily endonuclease
MAIRKDDGTFEPGVIYCLVSGDLNTDDFSVFYVGESTDWNRRYLEHKAAGKAATSDSTEVYKHINLLELNNIPWSLQVVQEYNETGPEALEAETMIKFTLAGCNLTNEKNGNMHWCQVLEEMSYLGITSYSEYQAHKKAEEEAKNALKIQISTTFLPLTKSQLHESQIKRKVAREMGLLPNRRKKK